MPAPDKVSSLFRRTNDDGDSSRRSRHHRRRTRKKEPGRSTDRIADSTAGRPVDIVVEVRTPRSSGGVCRPKPNIAAARNTAGNIQPAPRLDRGLGQLAPTLKRQCRRLWITPRRHSGLLSCAWLYLSLFEPNTVTHHHPKPYAGSGPWSDKFAPANRPKQKKPDPAEAEPGSIRGHHARGREARWPSDSIRSARIRSASLIRIEVQPLSGCGDAPS